MSGFLSEYTVMQENEWATRRFFTAHSHRTGQVVYLIAAPAQDPLAPYQHPSLPRVEPAGTEGQIHWLTGEIPEGDTLEDLRSRGALAESELVSGLLSVIDGMASLSQLDSPPVPTYLDPACIKRDRLGRWTLDYMALAHAPEARSAGSSPPGVYAFGVLLYWLITGETVRRSRVQVNRIESGASTGLQYIVVKCLGKSYKSLAQLRADIAQAGQDREFRRLVQRGGARAPEVEFHRVKLGGPQIPMDDRPWALPPRPAEGYRKYVVPPPPNPLVAKATRWGALGLVAVVTMALAAVAFVKAGVVPLSLLPWRGAPATMPDSAATVTPVEPSPSVAGPIAGPSLPPAAAPGKSVAAEPPAPAPAPPPTAQPQPTPQPKQPPAQPSPKPAPTPAPKPSPAPKPQPAPPDQPPTQPAAPQAPTPAPGSDDYRDASQGGLPVAININGAQAGWAWIFPHPATPYISLATFNRLFGRDILWIPVDGGSIRLLNGSQNVITSDYELVKDRLWLKLTPFVQDALGVKVTAYDEAGMHFTVMP